MTWQRSHSSSEWAYFKLTDIKCCRVGWNWPWKKCHSPQHTVLVSIKKNRKENETQVHMVKMSMTDMHNTTCTAWDSDIESLTSLNATIQCVQLETVKLSRWRHSMPVWSSLIAAKRGADTEWLRRWPRVRVVSFPVTPTCTRALRRWSMVYHRLLFSNDPAC